MTGTPVQGQLDLRFGPGARATADFTTSKGAVRPAGTNIAGQPYRGGPVATAENIEQIRGALAPRMQVRALSEEVSNKVAPGQGSFFLDNAPDIWTDAFRMRPELIRQLPREVQDRIGTVMMREATDLGPAAPRAAFGPGAGPAPVDPVASAAFARNAASGAELVDLGALFNNPAFRAATGAAGLGLFGAGVAGMMPGDRTGETTAGAPPSLPPTTPMFTEADGSPLGSAAPGVVTPPNLRHPATLIRPLLLLLLRVAGLRQESADVRAALAQTPLERQPLCVPWSP
jgi:hypothetical protein